MAKQKVVESILESRNAMKNAQQAASKSENQAFKQNKAVADFLLEYLGEESSRSLLDTAKDIAFYENSLPIAIYDYDRPEKRRLAKLVDHFAGPRTAEEAADGVTRAVIEFNSPEGVEKFRAFAANYLKSVIDSKKEWIEQELAKNIESAKQSVRDTLGITARALEAIDLPANAVDLEVERFEKSLDKLNVFNKAAQRD